MQPLSYLSPKTAVQQSAIEPQLQPTLGPAEIQIADDLFICPVTAEEREGSMIFSNHPCEPNLGLRGQIVFVAMRDIAADEELTHDWAMTDDSKKVDCHCGSVRYRRTISGKDWERPELQERYAGFFSSYLAEEMKS